MPEVDIGTLDLIMPGPCTQSSTHLMVDIDYFQLPFSLICAQDIFQKKVDETFGDLPSVTGIADNIVIYGCDLADHDTNLKAVMEHARETGLHFNADKCKIRCTEIPLFGHIMDPSTSLADLQTFLGMTVSQLLPAQPSITLSRPSGPHQEKQ